jgi:hypothetical protein
VIPKWRTSFPCLTPGFLFCACVHPCSDYSIELSALVYDILDLRLIHSVNAKVIAKPFENQRSTTPSQTHSLVYSYSSIRL